MYLINNIIDFFINIESHLNWISLIGTPISFFIAVLTWCNTQKLRTQVNTKLDLKELADNIENYDKLLELSINTLTEQKFFENFNNKGKLRNLFTEINQKYPNINKKIINNNNLAIELLSKPNNYSYSDDEVYNLLTYTQYLKNNLYKEVR